MQNDMLHGKLSLASFQACEKINNICCYIALFYAAVRGFYKKGLQNISHWNFYYLKSPKTHKQQSI